MSPLPKTYTAKRLLEHGPLTLREFVEVTGWNYGTAANALAQLVETGIAVFYSEMGCRQNIYRLREAV